MFGLGKDLMVLEGKKLFRLIIFGFPKTLFGVIDIECELKIIKNSRNRIIILIL